MTAALGLLGFVVAGPRTAVADATAPAAPRLVVELGPPNDAGAVAVSPDGRWIAVGGEGGVRWIDLESGRHVWTFEGVRSARRTVGVAFFAGGSRLAAAQEGGGVQIWDTASGREVRRFEPPDAGGGKLAVSSDGRWLLTTGYANDAYVWDLTNGARVAELCSDPSEGGQVFSLAISADGRWVLTGHAEGRVRLWDRASGREVRVFEGGTGAVASLAISPDARTVLAGSWAWENRMRLWDLDSGRETRRLPGTYGAFASDGLTVLTAGCVCALSPDGRHVVTALPERTAWLHDAASGVEVRRFDGPAAYAADREAALTPQGRSAAGDAPVVYVWDKDTGRRIRTLRGGVSAVFCLASSGDGRWVVTAGRGGTACLWDLDIGGQARVFRGHEGWIQSAALSQNARWLLTGSTDRTARLWDVRTGAEVRRYEGHSEYVMSVALSPDSRWVLTAAVGEAARLWDRETGKEVRKFGGPEADAGAIAFSPDGERVLTGGSRGEVAVWRREDARLVWSSAGHTRSVLSVAVSADGRRALSGSADGTARLWDLETGERIPAGGGGPSDLGYVLSVGFSRDGGRALVGCADGTAQVWSLDGWKEVQRFTGHSDSVYAALFSPDERFVLTASEDGTTRAWDAATGAELCNLVSLDDGSWAVVSPDGRFDASDLDDIRGMHWAAPDELLRPLPVECFLRDYYEARLLSRRLAGERMPPVRPLLELSRVLPRVALKVEKQGRVEDEVRLLVEIESVRDDTRPPGKDLSGARDLRVYRDGRLVAAADGPIEVDPKTRRAHKTFEHVRVPSGREGGEVSFTAYAFNTDLVKGPTTRASYAPPKATAPRMGTAYVLAIGVEAFEDPKWNLRFAADDATAFARVVAERLRATQRYRGVVSVTLRSRADGPGAQGGRTEDFARKADWAAAVGLLAGRKANGAAAARIPWIAGLARARPEDLVLLFIGTHGFTDARGEFYLVPSDVAAQGAEGWESSCVSATELASWMRDIDAGEMAMVVDACQSAGAVEQEGFKPGPMGSRGLGQLAYDKRMRILAASQKAGVALESGALGHGFLTYALLKDGLERGRADADGNGATTLAEWLAYGRARVPQLAEEVAKGKVALDPRSLPVPEPAGERGRLGDDTARRWITQEPALFDFVRERGEEDVVLTRGRK